MKNKKLRRMVFAAMIAAMYAALTLMLAPISFGNIQIRMAEAMVLLPVLFATSVPGVTLGCFMANLIGAMMGLNILGYLDCVVGTLATVLAAVLSRKFAHVRYRNIPWLSVLMPVLFNGVIIGLELAYALMPEAMLIGFVIFGFEVAFGELLAVGVFGVPLVRAFERAKIKERYQL